MNIPLSDYKRLLFLDRHGYFSQNGEELDDFLRLAPVAFENREAHIPVIVSLFWQKFLVDIRAVPVEEVSAGIHPWEMAFCLVDQEGRASIKVRKYQKQKEKVSREAVLTHEFVHALRGRIFSTKYEEIIAYSISAYLFPQDFPRWRTWLSPLFSSTAELIVSFVWMIGTFMAAFFIDTDISPFFIFLFSLLPIFFCTYRLHRRWSSYNKAYTTLSQMSPEGAYPSLFRLTDEDIDWLASLEKDSIVEKVRERAQQDWRWYFLKETFLR